MTVYERLETMFDEGKLDTTYPPSVYEAYLKAKELTLADLRFHNRKHTEALEDSYIGYFEDRKSFIDGLLEVEHALPKFVVVDYEATWERELRHFYDFVQADGVHEESGEGYYFTR